MVRHAAEESGRQLRPSDCEDSAPLPADEGFTTAPRFLSQRGPFQAWWSRPGALLAVGLALLAVGAALVATPLSMRLALPSSRGPPAASPPIAVSSGVNEEGVPLDALSQQQAEGELAECRVGLPDRRDALEAAAAAETQLFGAPVADLPLEQLQHGVHQLPPLLFSTVFWVLVGDSRTWAPEFHAAAAAQVEVLSSAFSSLGMRFRLDALVRTPATNQALLHCSSQWDELAQQLLLPPAALSPSGSSGRSSSHDGNSSEASSILSSAADPPAIHVIVCEPEGVQGASQVLAAAAPHSSSPRAVRGTILLRRSALWQSRTSLVHQLGHFFGLPHPFPDDRQTCKFDADGIADTPLQHSPNQGCDPGGDMHVCPQSCDGAVPVVNYMDLTSDICRRHFTLGQAARMQAMLRAYRPRLFQAASDAQHAQQVLVMEAAWQSAPPPSPKLEDPWQLAVLAADGQQSAAQPNCSCLGADAEGRAFWTGQLNASYAVHGLRLLMPARLGGGSLDGGAAPAPAPQSFATDADLLLQPAAEQELGVSASSVQGAEGVVSNPAAESSEQQQVATEPESELELAVWVGDSLDYSHNQRCNPGGSGGSGGATRLLLRQLPPLHEVRCEPPVSGRYITIELLAPGGPEAVQQLLSHRQLCLCEVQPLTAVALASPMLPGGHNSSSDGSTSVGSGGGDSPAMQPFPPVFLNLSAMEASQSSTVSAPMLALATAQQPLQAGGGIVPRCSHTGMERAPWWSLDTGLDGAWVGGLRLSLPFACQSTTNDSVAQDMCKPAPAISLSVYVGDVPPAQLAASGAVSSSGGGTTSSSSSMCAMAVPVLGGRPVEIRCSGGYLQGRYVTVMVVAAQAEPTHLSLCDVQLLGAAELAPSRHMAQPAPLLVMPPALQPYFAVPVDGDGGSCLEVFGDGDNGISSSSSSSNGGGTTSSSGTSSSSWELHLDGSYQLLAVRLDATAAASPNASLMVTLLDDGGRVAAHSWLPEPAAPPIGPSYDSSAVPILTVDVPLGTFATAVRVEGWSRLCELQLLAASTQPATSYRLFPLPTPPTSGGGNGSSGGALPAWHVLRSGEGAFNSTADSTFGSTPSLAGSGGAEVFDGDYRSCLTAKPSMSAGGGRGGQHPAALEVLLDRPYRVQALQLLSGGTVPLNVTIAAAVPGPVAVSNSAAAATTWATAPLCQPLVTLHPWQSTVVACSDAPLLTDRLRLQLVPPGMSARHGTPDAAAQQPLTLTLTLCELQLFGLP